jgi:hypothetical protein
LREPLACPCEVVYPHYNNNSSSQPRVIFVSWTIKWENKCVGHPMMNVFTVFTRIACWTGSCGIQNVQSVDEIILSNVMILINHNHNNNHKKKKQARMQDIVVIENLNRRKCVYGALQD